MKTLNDAKTFDTWLPIFSGFYGTIWETDSDEESEIEHINEQRKEKGLPEIEWDDIEWAYPEYMETVCKMFTSQIEGKLTGMGMIEACKMQKIVSPREYNFTNDSVNVEITLTRKNVIAVQAYLVANMEAFETYILDRYSSRSGFMSFHSNDVTAWTGDNLGETLADGHKLGSVLNFILLNEDENIEMEIYEDVKGNGGTLYAKNYAALTEKTK